MDAEEPEDPARAESGEERRKSDRDFMLRSIKAENFEDRAREEYAEREQFADAWESISRH